ncbi:hypothetical protein QTH87_05795 [Variovorax sp. J22P168]|uniref:hypothetical protein n=1 Tax=Variovorax jilinensis TaxID=3053513 RepID=UPI002576C999|nr:hypothetical protein [Variovorax sp. J22P168]MDM0011950.1 hypothetical protein [Variovorax sp. J22P168]
MQLDFRFLPAVEDRDLDWTEWDHWDRAAHVAHWASVAVGSALMLAAVFGFF